MLHTIMGWERAWPELLEAVAIGYLVGSVPFGILVARLFSLGDLRRIGSGNIGATNVLRTGSKGAAALTLLLDMAKGALPAAWFLAAEGDLAAQCASLGALVGHCFPIWLRFKGGKGVATALGICLGLSWIAGAAICAVWLASAALTRRSSVGALGAMTAAPILFWVLDGPRAVMCLMIAAAIVILRHRENIMRLLSGTEPKIGSGA